MPDIVKVMPSPSASVAVIVPTAVWFSFALKVGSDENLGSLSFKLITFTVITCVEELAPSLAVTVAVYSDLVS